MTLTKIDIVEQVANKCGFSKLEAADLVETIFDLIKESLTHGTSVKVSGFGNFILRDKKSRMGRNPQTGEAMEISPRRVMSFKVSQVLKEAINSGKIPEIASYNEADDPDSPLSRFHNPNPGSGGYPF